MSDYFPPPPWTTEMQWHGTAIKAAGQTLARVNSRADPWVEAATARLIAAAPDLLTALEGFLAWEMDGSIDTSVVELCARAEQAIKAARGLEDY